MVLRFDWDGWDGMGWDGVRWDVFGDERIDRVHSNSGFGREYCGMVWYWYSMVWCWSSASS
jgi:hypothetical protein